MGAVDAAAVGAHEYHREHDFFALGVFVVASGERGVFGEEGNFGGGDAAGFRGEVEHCGGQGDGIGADEVAFGGVDGRVGHAEAGGAEVHGALESAYAEAGDPDEEESDDGLGERQWGGR